MKYNSLNSVLQELFKDGFKFFLGQKLADLEECPFRTILEGLKGAAAEESLNPPIKFELEL